MSNRTKELLRRFLSLRNIVPLLIIIAAFIGTFVANPFGLQRDQILLGLLAFLAIDALIERLELLTNIEQDVGVIRELVTSQTAGEGLLRFRRDFPRTPDLIDEAKKEIWVSGIALDSMVQVTGDFREKLREGINLRFLAVKPEENLVEETANYLGESSDNLVRRLQTNLSTLYGRLVQANPQQVEVRVIDHRPTLGCFIVDPHDEQGYMTVEPYLYRTESSDRPILRLSKGADSRWFNAYLDDFEKLWYGAVNWEP